MGVRVVSGATHPTNLSHDSRYLVALRCAHPAGSSFRLCMDGACSFHGEACFRRLSCNGDDGDCCRARADLEAAGGLKLVAGRLQLDFLLVGAPVSSVTLALALDTSAALP